MPQLIEGAAPILVQGSGAKPYELKNVGGVYSCSCMAWRNQGVAINKRTCKHLKAHCGAQNEAARIGAPAPAQPAPALSAAPTVVATQAPAGTREATIEAQEASLGRKLRQDEKAKLFGPPVLLANSWDEDGDSLDPTGWWHSEKLDGVRAYWDGSKFVTRQGNVYEAPAWFTKGFPSHPLDGELWMGRRMFQKTISVVKSGPSDRWREVCYMVFDVPAHGGVFEDRIAEAGRIATSISTPWIKCHQHGILLSRDHLIQELHRIEALGGEGVMIRKPKSLYEPRRSSTLLKVKPFKDSEAVVIGHTPGKGRHKGVVGALEVRMPDGKTFLVGSGLTDVQRRNPPPIGCTITYRYTDTTNDGIPKCGSFVCIRDYE